MATYLYDKDGNKVKVDRARRVSTMIESGDYFTSPDADPGSEKIDRDAIKKELTDLGVEFNTRAQTDTLVALLEEAKANQ